MAFKKILIANRGEIAVRIQRTCKELGIETVAVHSTEDEECLHVKMADESVCIGPAKSALSYLNIPSLLSAAEITEADAIHPGFGFLSENEEFAELCGKWNITFIGPNVEAIKKMGDKILSKKIAKEAGVPTLEPISVVGRTHQEVADDVKKIGFPILVKASAGGGGKGMQRVDAIEQLVPALVRLEQEAKAAFGDGTLFIEKYITNPRHVEVQVLGDKHNNVIHLGERDCTVQRRFQKLIEESPSPCLDEKTRKSLCESAVALAKYVGYDSAGTVEYLYDQDAKKFYFMEMNTRIQVEHPVTEERTGIDIIAEQIRVASGAKLRFHQKDIVFRGHALECRVNAEDPITARPCPGKINRYYRPGGIGVRVDDFIYSGYRISPYYDSMLAKVIVKGETRADCIARMKRALNEMILEGITSNISLHQKILAHPDFTGNNYATDFLTKVLG